jgi:hypothetical protein
MPKYRTRALSSVSIIVNGSSQRGQSVIGPAPQNA